MDMKFEVAVVPVSDVDRAKQFYESLGWRMDIDYVADEDFRVVQLTPPGSEASIIIGKGVTSAAPGSVDGLQLVVVDVEAARDELVGRGVDVAEVFHDVGGVFHHAGTAGREAGPDPKRGDYASFASFSDPDGNGWVLQGEDAGPGTVTGHRALDDKMALDQERRSHADDVRLRERSGGRPAAGGESAR